MTPPRAVYGPREPNATPQLQKREPARQLALPWEQYLTNSLYDSGPDENNGLPKPVVTPDQTVAETVATQQPLSDLRSMTLVIRPSRIEMKPATAPRMKAGAVACTITCES
jgi:hypothetical protein